MKAALLKCARLVWKNPLCEFCSNMDGNMDGCWYLYIVCLLQLQLMEYR
jgi:hypothetical protein